MDDTKVRSRFTPYILSGIFFLLMWLVGSPSRSCVVLVADRVVFFLNLCLDSLVTLFRPLLLRDFFGWGPMPSADKSEKEWILDQQGWIPGLMALGCVAGSLPSGT